MRKWVDYFLISLSSILLCAIPLYKASFLEIPSVFELFLLILASFLTGFQTASLNKAFIIFYASYFISVIGTILAVRLPLDIYMGSFAGDLATIVIARNVAFFSFIIVLPITVIFLVIGTYIGEKLRRFKK
ncbi:MAG: hypothetical protein J7J67_02775 [Thermoproteales archaeon]|nr:hypothetical protein [Thermoproteales archaeon]